MVTFTSVSLYRLRKSVVNVGPQSGVNGGPQSVVKDGPQSGVNGGPQSGSRRLRENGTDSATKFLCGICFELMGLCYEKFNSGQIFGKKIS